MLSLGAKKEYWSNINAQFFPNSDEVIVDLNLRAKELYFMLFAAKIIDFFYSQIRVTLYMRPGLIGLYFSTA